MFKTATQQNVNEGAIKKVFITQEEWGQPPASHYRFRIDGTRMYGVPISSLFTKSVTSESASIDSDLREELRVWDNLSDEAFINFEDSIE